MYISILLFFVTVIVLLFIFILQEAKGIKRLHESINASFRPKVKYVVSSLIGPLLLNQFVTF